MVQYCSGIHTIAPEKLAKALAKLPDAPWAGTGLGAGITARRIASLLAPYEIASQRNRDGRLTAP